MKNGLIWVGLVSVLISGTAFAERMLDVADGETIVLETGQIVRLWGIKAPGIYQPLGKEAINYLQALLYNRELILKDCRSQAEGESVCKISAQIPRDDGGINSLDPSEEMIAKGLAYELSAVTRHVYAKTEAAARTQKLGIWNLSKEEREANQMDFEELPGGAQASRRYRAEAHRYRLTLHIPNAPLKTGENTYTLEINTRTHDAFHTNDMTAQAVYTDTQGNKTVIPTRVLTLPIMGEYQLKADFPHAGQWQLEIQPTPTDEIICFDLEVSH